jgi:hypothetical protein
MSSSPFVGLRAQPPVVVIALPSALPGDPRLGRNMKVQLKRSGDIQNSLAMWHAKIPQARVFEEFGVQAFIPGGLRRQNPY